MRNSKKRKKTKGKEQKSKNSKTKEAIHKKDESPSQKKLTPGRAKAIYGISLLAFAVFTFICIVSPESAGIVGRGVKSGLSWLLGVGRFAVPAMLFAGSILSFYGKREVKLGFVILGLSIITVSALIILHIQLKPERMFITEELYLRGGALGAVFAWPLVKLIGKIASYIFASASLIIGIVLAFEEQLSRIYKSVKKEKQTKVSIKPADETPEKEISGEKAKESSPRVFPEMPKPTPVESKGTPQLQMRIKPEYSGKYRLPPTSILLSSHDKAFSQKTNEERKRAIEQTLSSMGVDAKVVKVSKGPTVSLFEVEVGTGEKVRRVTELEQDIAYALGSPDIRIYSPIPGKQAIGIEVPNHVRDTVLLGDIMSSLGPIQPHNLLTCAIGKDMRGEPVILDLAQLPHLLLAGSTGAGKSCCINSIVSCLLFRCTPEQLRLIMIDPKFVEFTFYEGLPHLLCDIINEPEEASKALNWAVQEMERRYQELQRLRVVHIDDYNAIAFKDRNLEPMPKIVIVIDELGDLMIVARREVESSISRLTAKARAVGIHLIIATQRPSVDVITGVIKNNITARIAFQVASIADSRTILQTKGAEKLLGKGDMLLDPGNIPQPLRVQGAFIQKKEIELLTGFIREQKYVKTDKINLEEEGISVTSELQSRDPLLEEAAEFVVFAGEASASMLQTHLRVGYARARRLIVELAELGIVGPHEGSKSRKVLITPEELKEWKKKRIHI